ncbi:YkgJ family cysteine cluster protein [Clostridium sp. MCC353]|uniref:flagellin lysine-N-methylase n=1 Tax=Clostridium sp. MCC353 TaxID=2592646 RepID=UPI001C01096E|nr:flagellin lysine-N-methylase [Clostridium sp. MCC353]MBT9775659.1 YkgJ family cysteine cluster protein [Clostridium sp. MCC353]
MIYTVPHYYNKFRCTASGCEDTCCAGWQIMIDEKTLEKYRNMRGAFGNRLHNSIDWKESSFKQYRRRCAFLNEDNLCDIYTEAGPKMLCRTCRNYPRHMEEFEGCREISLSLSCMEAARLILGCEEPVHFLTKEGPGQEEYPEFDFLLYTKLTDARDVMIALMQNRAMRFETRAAMVLALAHDLQRRISRSELFSVDSLLMRYQREGAGEAFEKKLQGYFIDGQKRYGIMKQMFQVLDELEVLKQDWPAYKNRLARSLFAEGPEAYESAGKAFERELSMDEGYLAQWQLWGEQLMVYFIFTYFCGAVYDGRPFAKIKLAAVSTLLIREMARAFWQESKKRLELEDMVEIAHRYSKEVEHSDLNLKRLEEIFLEKGRFDLEKLLRAVIS